MKFINMCRYIDDLDRVAELRPSHRMYMAQLESEGKLWAAGPFENGTGALFIYEAVDQHTAEEIVRADPYFTGGAFATSELVAWSPALYNTVLRTPWLWFERSSPHTCAAVFDGHFA
jgi:uncharacterized protein